MAGRSSVRTAAFNPAELAGIAVACEPAGRHHSLESLKKMSERRRSSNKSA